MKMKFSLAQFSPSVLSCSGVLKKLGTVCIIKGVEQAESAVQHEVDNEVHDHTVLGGSLSPCCFCSLSCQECVEVGIPG